MSGETPSEVPKIPEVPKRPRKILIAILLAIIVVIAILFSSFMFGIPQLFPKKDNGIPQTETLSYSKYEIEFEYPEGYEITEETMNENITWSQAGTAGGKPIIWNHSRIVNTIVLKNGEDLIAVIWTGWEKPEQPFNYYEWKFAMAEVTIKSGRVMFGEFGYGDFIPAKRVRYRGEIVINGHDEYDASATWSDEPEMRSAKMEYASITMGTMDPLDERVCYGTGGQFYCFDTERIFCIWAKSYTEDADRQAFFIVCENFKCH